MAILEENWGNYQFQLDKYLSLLESNPYIGELRDNFLEKKQNRLLEIFDNDYAIWIKKLMLQNIISGDMIDFLNITFERSQILRLFGKYVKENIELNNFKKAQEFFTFNDDTATSILSLKYTLEKEIPDLAFTPTKLKFVTTTALAWLAPCDETIDINFKDIYTNFVPYKNVLEIEDEVIYKDEYIGKIVGCKTGGDAIKGYFKKKTLGDFYNCTTVNVVISPIKSANVKIFNNGKLQMTGIPKPEDGILVSKYVTDMIKKMRKDNKKIIMNKDYPLNLAKYKTVMINTCYELGYCINREVLYNIIYKRYGLNTIYDSDGYPGVRIEYYYNTNNVGTIGEGRCGCCEKCKGKGTGDGKGECRKISIAIFQSGSAIIAGGCTNSEPIFKAYAFINNIIKEILSEIVKPDTESNKLKKKLLNTVYLDISRIVNKSVFEKLRSIA